ncbi:MAG: hypothetical protein AMJ37_04840 [Dehalococcoidia bacterium DG_18]|nr:MAG: hypothetical protein AMJ37_04840 [Dehalococcoidia bacterium DG_18]
MTSERVKKLERKLADLKRRWPPHSVPPGMLEQLDELEQMLEEARGQTKKSESGDASNGGLD